MFRHLEKEMEKAVRFYAVEFQKAMKWEKLKIARFKVGRMLRYRGYAMIVRKTKKEKAIIFISDNPRVYTDGIVTEKEFWHIVTHELVHIYMYQNGYSVEEAFGHGKSFIKVCEEIQKMSRGYFTVKGLMR